MDLGTRIITWLRGVSEGTDELGNRYYRDRRGRNVRNNGRERRWVIYAGEAEGSKVPAQWHAWLHHTTDTVPDEAALKRRDWQLPHEPNLTGTPGAYRPPGSLLRGGRRAPATGDYEPWRPE